MRKPDKGLTPMEQEVMKVLWESQHELTNSEIAESMKDQTMKRLLEKGAVCVGDHVLVSNVYARTFHPCITRKEFVRQELIRLCDTAYRDQIVGMQEILDILEKQIEV